MDDDPDVRWITAAFLEEAGCDVAEAGQRAAYLDRECGADADLRAAIVEYQQRERRFGGVEGA